jgi:hypothetical protein
MFFFVLQWTSLYLTKCLVAWLGHAENNNNNSFSLWTVKQISYSYLNTLTWTLYDRSVACIPATRSPYVLGDNGSKMHINKVPAGVAFLESIDDYSISDMRI